MKEKSEKVSLKLNIQKTKTMASGPITSWQIDGETVETVTDFLFLTSKIMMQNLTQILNIIYYIQCVYNHDFVDLFIL